MNYNQIKQIPEQYSLLDIPLKPLANVMTYININYIKLKPNTLTFMGFTLGIISGLFFLTEYYVIGAVLYLFRYLFDWIDGKVARATNNTTELGAFLDNYSGSILNIWLLYCFFYDNFQIAFLLLAFINLRLIASLVYNKNRSLPKKYGLIKDYVCNSDLKHILFFITPLFFIDYKIFIALVVLGLLILKEIAVFIYYVLKKEVQK